MFDRLANPAPTPLTIAFNSGTYYLHPGSFTEIFSITFDLTQVIFGVILWLG